VKPAEGATAPSLEASGRSNGGGGYGGGRGEGGSGRFGGQGAQSGDGGDRQARMLERLKAMTPDEQQQFIARMKERGMDTSVFEKMLAPAGQPKGNKPKAGAPTQPTATTIDALFAPLPSTVSQGRVWLDADKQLKPVRVRLGITDGTNTELLNGEIQEGTEVVTGVVLPTSARPAANAGNPLLQQGGRGPGGFGGGFPGGGRGR
jgi:HlyD family secretion protein